MISRDDKDRFESHEDKFEKFMNSENFLQASIGGGGDSTLNMKNFLKNLKSLTGGDDSIFVIIDDRSDVWTQEVKTDSGQIKKKKCQNLI